MIETFNPFRLDNVLPLKASANHAKRLIRTTEKLLGLGVLAQAYAALPPSRSPAAFAASVLRHFDISHEITGNDLCAIPETGPVVIVANHPFGAVEGVLLLHLLSQRRKDVKVMANSLLKRVPELADCFIGVNPYATKSARLQNLRAMRQAVHGLKSGGVLLVFPAGDVASLQLKQMRITEGIWDTSIAKLVRISSATVVPVFIEGRNAHRFNLLGKIHPRIRTALLPRQFLGKTKTLIRLKVGTPITCARLMRIGDNSEIAHYLRLRTLMLGNRNNGSGEIHKNGQNFKPGLTSNPAPASPANPQLLSEISQLPKTQKLATSADMDVYYAHADQIPLILNEIGRLREITFRASGEGTGRTIDLDAYDQWYLHLFIWDREAAQIVGAYRLGLGDEIMRDHGKQGFYSHSLFRFGDAFAQALNPAIELGRSFVCAPYQKSVVPMMLLWKGIGAFTVRHLQYTTLFGPVSISSNYSPVSAQLMIDYFTAGNAGDPLQKLIRPRTPYRRNSTPCWRKCDLAGSGSIDGLSEIIYSLESDAKGVPVLIRHYLNFGGRMLGFNVDRHFGNCIDGLVVVDLRRANRRILNRYMGVRGAEQFLACHAKQMPLVS